MSVRKRSFEEARVGCEDIYGSSDRNAASAPALSSGEPAVTNPALYPPTAGRHPSAVPPRDRAPTRASVPEVHNQLLAALTPSEFARLRPHLTRVQLVRGQTLHESDECIEHAYFIETGLVSTAAMVDEPGEGAEARRMIEVGMVGPEGLVGLPALLHPRAISYERSFVQIEGVALRIPSPALRAAAQSMPVLERRLLDALQVAAAETAQIAACNTRHAVLGRLATRLLMAHDRADGNELPLTHEVLAVMLGVQRSGVTVAIGALEQVGLIRRSRSRIAVADRAGLEAASCGCYARVRAFAARVGRRVAVTD